MPTPSPSYRGYVYLIGSRRFGWFKIGKAKIATIRLENIGILLPFKIEVFAVWMCENPTDLERLMHERHSSSSINGEWFYFDRHKLKEVLSEEPPCHAVKIEDAEICQFSNLREDVVDAQDREMKMEQSRLFMQTFREFMLTKGLEDTPENRKAARKYMKSLQESKRDIIFPESG